MEELLTCSVCCERYCEQDRQPVLLPRCGHSFCRPCVTLLLTGGAIICPTCRTDQRVESAHRLPTEFTLLAIIAAQENSKLDNCRRHDVKLSFWCKTCGQPTCGECLFEDHPTHSHCVIRSNTYIQNIKDSVQEVACKFMEALDTREQSYYTTVYTCAKKIDNVLRNVTVLRKDMSEARQLMKGIKEEDTSISTATSLAEAAKYLGLKWNIQDANFNRDQEDEKYPNKKSVSEDKDDGKKEKVIKKKKKSITGKESKKEEKEDDKSEKVSEEPKKAVTPEPVMPETTEAEAPKEIKRKSSLRKSKTLSVFEPFSMDKEITEIKEKTFELDNKERERIEMETLQRIEEEEQDELDKKTLEQKKEEAKKEADAAVLAIQAAAAAEEEIIRKQEEEERKRVEEQDAKNKADDLELEKLNEILKRPKGRLARKYIAEKEKADAEKAEKEKLEREAAEKEKSESSEIADKEKMNGNPEHTDKDKDDDSTEAQGDSAECDPYAGELTLEEKEAKEKDNQQNSENIGGILDFMKDPLFKICVEGAEGRLALLQWEPKGLHVYCHQYQQLNYDIAIKTKVLHAMIPSKSPLVFLELSVGTGGRPRRIYIRLWGHLRRAHNFLALCIGDEGSAFINTKLLQIYNYGEEGERILGGDYEFNCGRGGRGLLDDLEWNGDYTQPMREGLLTAAGSGQHATNSLFLICTRSDETRNFSCPYGEVVEGLDDVRSAIKKSKDNDEEVWVTECGVVLEPPRALI